MNELLKPLFDEIAKIGALVPQVTAALAAGTVTQADKDAIAKGLADLSGFEATLKAALPAPAAPH